MCGRAGRFEGEQRPVCVQHVGSGEKNKLDQKHNEGEE